MTKRFKAKAKGSTFEVEGYLIEDKYRSIICSGFYEHTDCDGDKVICLKHAHYVDRETIKEMEDDEET